MGEHLAINSEQNLGSVNILWDGQAASLPFVLLDDLPHLVWVKDAQGCYVYINGAYRRFHGLQHDSERIGLTDAQIYPEKFAARYRQEDINVITTRLPIKFEDGYDENNSHFPVMHETIKRPLFSLNGSVLGVYGVSRDISAKKAEESKTARQNRLLASLHEVSLELMKQHDIDLLLKTILKSSAEVMGAPGGSINFVDSESDALRVAHAWGPEAAAPENYRIKRGQGLVGQVWDRGAVIVVEDYQTWEHRNPQSYLENIRAIVGVPIHAGQNITGVFTLIHTDPDRRFDATDVAILEQFSALASVALENARLFENAAFELQQRQESEMRYRALVQQSSDVILLFDPVTRRLLEANARYLSLAGYTDSELAALSIYDVIVDEKRWIDHYLDVILPRDRAISPETRRFRRKDGTSFELERSAWMVSIQGRDVMMTVGRDISERRHTHLMEFLHDTTLDIIGHQDQDKMLSTMLKRAVSLVGASAGHCSLLDEESSELRIVTSVGLDPGFLVASSFKNAGLTGHVWNSGEAMVVNDYPSWEGRLQHPRFDRITATAVFPLKNSAREVIGLLSVIHFDSTKRIQTDDFDCLEEVAHLVSLALDSARLYRVARVEIATRAEIELQVRYAYEKLDATYDTTLEGWARALDLRDCETEGHSRRVASVAVEMARAMNIPVEQHIHVWRGALLHDIGKLGVPDSILLKPGSLTPEEWQIMRLHPVYGFDWLLPIEYLRPALAIPRSHHERWDGTGYPDRLSGENIPLEARIFAPIDVWDALSSNRPYRRSWPDDRIRDHIRSLAGSHFDPAVVDAFLSLPPDALVIQSRTNLRRHL